MKKTIKPPVREEAVYYSDFSGKHFGSFAPEVILNLEFNYGSKFDGAKISFDLTDEEIEPIITLIKTRLSENTKKEFQKQLKSQYLNLDNSISARDYSQSDYYNNCSELLKSLIE